MTNPADLPVIIQGGMGVGVSGWPLARSVTAAGQLGVVSGTALDLVVSRRLQDGDRDGAIRRALARFPAPAMAERVLRRYFRPDGRAPQEPYRPVPKLVMNQSQARQELTVVGNFVEVWLAKEGQPGPVGINYLEKIQMATPAAVFGAVLAGVDVVLMGAGIPREVPQLLSDLCAGRPGTVSVDVHGGALHRVELDPHELLGMAPPALSQPQFLAVVSSSALAAYLARDERTRPDGFVVEGPGAGGHNAPPRGRRVLSDDGEPVYGPRDDVDLEQVAAIGAPFWLAGGYGSPARLEEARRAGAAGIQVGTPFALAEESGLTTQLKGELLAKLASGTLLVRTDPDASPTGFPFKVAQLASTLSDTHLYESRQRICDLGYLRTPYLTGGRDVGYRCPGEPEQMYVRKGGDANDTRGRQCLCNALLATVGLGQHRSGGSTELPLVTLGQDLEGARALAGQHPAGWRAADVVRWLLSASTQPA